MRQAHMREPMQYFKVSSLAMCRLIFHHYSKNYSPNYLLNEYLKVVYHKKKIRLATFHKHKGVH